MKLCAKAIVQNVSVCTGKGSVDCIDGFLDQMKRGKQMNKMSKFESYSRFLTRFVALLLVAFVAM